MTLLFQRRRGVATAMQDDRVTLIDAKGRSYFGLKGVGIRVWDLLSELRTLNEIVVVLSSEYDVEPQILENDVRRFLSQLLNSNLVEKKRAS